jgi:hypothetical protein
MSTQAPKADPKAVDELPFGLPPIDGDDGDGEGDRDSEQAPAELLDDDAIPKDDGGDPFDDSTGEDAAVTDVPDADGEESMLDAGEAGGVDIGGHDLVAQLDASELASGIHEEEGAAHEDYGLKDEAAAPHLDGGEDGPESDDESLTDDGLPPLEQDDDGALDQAEAFFDADLSMGEPRRAWSSAWERLGAQLSLPPSRALARIARGVLSAGRELSRVDLEGAIEPLVAKGLRGAEATRVLVLGESLFVTTERGGLFRSTDGGKTFTELPSWREHVRPEDAAAGLDVVGSDQGLWGRTAQGYLLVSVDKGELWEKSDVDGFVHGLGMDDTGAPVVLVRGVAASEVLRRTASGWTRTPLPRELLSSQENGPASLSARGKSVAVAIEGEGVVRSIDGGVWSRLPGTQQVTALAMLDATGSVVVAVQGAGREREEEGSAVRLLCFGADGEPRTVAAWDEPNDVAITGIEVDDAHEVVWVGGGFGVAVFQPRM